MFVILSMISKRGEIKIWHVLKNIEMRDRKGEQMPTWQYRAVWNVLKLDEIIYTNV